MERGIEGDRMIERSERNVSASVDENSREKGRKGEMGECSYWNRGKREDEGRSGMEVDKHMRGKLLISAGW